MSAEFDAFAAAGVDLANAVAAGANDPADAIWMLLPLAGWMPPPIVGTGPPAGERPDRPGRDREQSPMRRLRGFSGRYAGVQPD